MLYRSISCISVFLCSIALIGAEPQIRKIVSDPSSSKTVLLRTQEDLPLCRLAKIQGPVTCLIKVNKHKQTESIEAISGPRQYLGRAVIGVKTIDIAEFLKGTNGPWAIFITVYCHFAGPVFTYYLTPSSEITDELISCANE